jgi:hypothetical protein
MLGCEVLGKAAPCLSISKSWVEVILTPSEYSLSPTMTGIGTTLISLFLTS